MHVQDQAQLHYITLIFFHLKILFFTVYIIIVEYFKAKRAGTNCGGVKMQRNGSGNYSKFSAKTS